MLVVAVLASSAAAESPVDFEEPSSSVDSQAVELSQLRTATSNTYVLPSGERETRLFQTPVNFQDEDGDWKPIDESLEEPPSGGLTNAANSFDLQLPEQLGTGSVRLSQDDQWLSYRLLGAQTEQAEVEGATAVYDAADGDLSFELHSLANGVKEEIVLADSSQPKRYNFALDFAQGLSPSLADDGSIRVEDSNGSLFATLPAPTIADASGSSPSNAVHYSLQGGSEAGHWTLTVEADGGWLSDPDRAWPVTIDPSAFIFTEQDCSVGSTPLPNGWVACGNNGAPELTTAYSQIEKQPVRTFLRFKLGSPKNGVLPWNAYVRKATLKLYSPKAAENTVPGLETRRVTKDWTTQLNWQKYKETANWTTPGGDFTSEGKAEVLTATRPSGSAAGWWEFSSQSLRDLVESWIEFLKTQNSEIGLKNQGLVVKQVDETRTAECESSGVCPRRYVTFNSSAAVSNKPELDVIYYPMAPSTNKMTSPTEGTTTARRLLVQSAWAPGVTGVRYQYRAGKKGQFTDIPPALLRNAKGEAVEELAVSESCCKSEPLFFDAAHINSELQSKGGTIQIRALFEGGTGAGISTSVEAKVDRYLGGPKDEMTQAGPGTLDLLTGNLNLSANDVSIGGFNSLSFSRSYNTRVPGTTGEKTILGQGWSSGAELAGGSDWFNLFLTNTTETIEGETETSEYATVRSIKGTTIAFEKIEGKYLPPDELPDYALVLSEGKFILTDADGNRTTFGNENSGNSSEYWPLSVSQLGGGSHATVMTWSFVNGQRRLVREVAPTTARSSNDCSENPTTKIGCRTLEFTYAPATKWGAPAAYGDRLEKITFFAPGEGGPWDVAAYGYDNLGRLVSAWDPRIGSSLKNTYTYEGEALRKVGIAGQEPWTLEYGPNFDGETGPVSRLKSVKRSNLLGGETTTSIRYEVPVSGSGAPNNMSASSVATWGQTDLPTDATAVFPPTEVPSESPSSYAKATLFYMDYEGFGVNAVTPSGAGMSGPAISTTETDEFGNVTRELTPQNRLRALAEPEGKRVERSHLLESKFTYSANGTELLEERGPLHRVKLQETGEIAEARLQRSIAYDNPANLSPPPLVPTRVVTGAVFPAKGTEVDQRVTEYKYNWNLRAQTEVITDAGIGHLNIRHVTAYNGTTGFPNEVRQPKASDETGNVPGVVKTTYFENNPNACGGKEERWAGLPCMIAPAAQPEGKPLPTIWIKSYSPLGRPTEIVEEVPGAGEAGIRKTVLTYDPAGRQTSTKITGGGTPVPKVETLYSSTNGMPTTQQFVCETGECAGFDSQATTTTFDALGRVETYEDADGNKSKTTYDSFGRPSTFYDGKGTQTVEYDPATSLIVKLTDSAAGTFTAGYDADGNMVKRGLPDGLTAETTIDPTGAAVGLTYTKASNCGVSCTWLSFANDQSIYGQSLVESSLQKTSRYVYDRAGRLSEAQETPAGGNCTTRSYGYDKDSNRLSMSTITSILGGGCGTGSTAEKKYSYDKADRLVDPGVVYDNFGRITTLPAADAGGSNLTTSYFATDMVATQSQNGITNSFELDATLRQRSRLQGGAGLEGVEVFHYGEPGDSPTWTQRGTTWTRNIVGIGGELVALQESGKELTLRLTNLHGDIVATAAINSEATALKGTFAYDEFGNPTAGSAGRFGWLGEQQRRTELPAGVIQMGARSYVPTIGRFISVDPVRGGSANSYDYANQDPTNNFDLGGENTSYTLGAQCQGKITLASDYIKPIIGRGGYGKLHLHWIVVCEHYVTVLKVTSYLEHAGRKDFYHSNPTKNPSSPHWDRWGTGFQGPGRTFTCLYGLEYTYVYEFQYEYNASAGKESFSMSAHAICGVEPS
ncbi:MAG TPA: RHS repeat-associated core domain-containing protein [Solirubrobacterales bacterium]|nr:RHS repeat-associated core domain-containing protein [Solirubrobacterales bacterium]